MLIMAKRKQSEQGTRVRGTSNLYILVVIAIIAGAAMWSFAGQETIDWSRDRIGDFKHTVLKPCTDADRGLMPNTAGVCEDDVGLHEDECSDTGEVVEYGCEKRRCVSHTIACGDWSCVEGACTAPDAEVVPADDAEAVDDE